MKIKDLINHINSSITRKDFSQIESYILAEHLLGQSKAWILSHEEDQIEVPIFKQANSLIQKRNSGIPIEYITGKKEFYKSGFIVNSNVLIPRPETEMLVDMAIEFIQNSKKDLNILEIGFGSGCIGISILKELKQHKYKLNYIATDISKKAINIARKNQEEILGQLNSSQMNLSILHVDIYGNNKIYDGKFDLIISNPPYIPSARITKLKIEVQKEPKLALDGGKDGMYLLRRIVKKTHNLLSLNGRYMLEVDSSYAHRFACWMDIKGIKSKVKKDQYNKNRFIIGTL